MTDIKVIIADYIRQREQQTKLETRLAEDEQLIADYCKAHKKKSINYKDQILLVVSKSKTTFPSKSSPQRKELELILKKFGIADEFESIDITRLASAYDLKKLEREIITALNPLAETKPYIRISLLHASRRP